MATRASTAAIELASRLREMGFADVSDLRVQRWRERGLLGNWAHSHAGGPGSAAVPPSDVLLRCKIVARLPRTHRQAHIVTLALLTTGFAPDVEEVRAAVAKTFADFIAPTPSDKADGYDRARSAVDQALQSRRALNRTRALAAERLSDFPDSQHHDAEEPKRSVVERAIDVHAAGLAALGGDPSWMSPVLPDALALIGAEDVVREADFLDPVVAADFGADFESAIGSMVEQLEHLDVLSPADIEIVAQIASALVPGGADDMHEIADPDTVAALMGMMLLSQMARPGVLGVLSDVPQM